MTERPVVGSRLIFGLVVLTLGVLWTLDNLGVLDASQILQWWPLIPLTWGVMSLTGLGCSRRPVQGAIWTVVGGVSLLHTLGLLQATVFDLWPLILIAIGASIVTRAWSGGAWVRGGRDAGSRINTFAFMAGAERKVVTQALTGGDVGAIMGGATLDLRPAALADGKAAIDVFAMWGGIDIIVPTGWRVVGEVTPLLGGFEDSTAPPVDPAAPTLVVRGLVLMGGVEVKNEPRRSYEVIEEEVPGEGERRPSGNLGIFAAGRRVVVRRRDGTTVKEIRVGPGGVTIRKGPADVPPEPDPGVSKPDPS